MKKYVDLAPVLRILTSIGFVRKEEERSVEEGSQSSDDKSNNKPPVEQVLVLEGNVDVGQIKDLLNILDGLSSESGDANTTTSKAEKLEIKKSESGGGGDAATSEGKQESSTGGNGDESGTGTKRSPDGKAQLKSLDVATTKDVDEPSAKKRKEV